MNAKIGYIDPVSTRNLRSSTLAARKAADIDKSAVSSRKRNRTRDSNKGVNEIQGYETSTVTTKCSSKNVFPIFKAGTGGGRKYSKPAKQTSKKDCVKYFPIFQSKSDKLCLLAKTRVKDPDVITSTSNGTSNLRQCHKPSAKGKRNKFFNKKHQNVKIESEKLPKSEDLQIVGIFTGQYEKKQIDIETSESNTCKKYMTRNSNKTPIEKKHVSMVATVLTKEINAVSSVTNALQNGQKNALISEMATKGIRTKCQQFTDLMQNGTVSHKIIHETTSQDLYDKDTAEFKNIELISFPKISHIKQYFYSENNESDVVWQDENAFYDIKWTGFLGIIENECNTYLCCKETCTEQVDSSEPILSNTSMCVEVGLMTMDLEVPSEDSSHCYVNSMQWTDQQKIFNIEENLNNPSIKVIRSWLVEWRSKHIMEKKMLDSENDDSDFEDTTSLEKAFVVTGLPGTGKTSIINCLASELGFTVLEVNASSCRSSRHIMSQLKEAFHSYHMESVTSKEELLAEKDFPLPTSTVFITEKSQFLTNNSSSFNRKIITSDNLKSFEVSPEKPQIVSAQPAKKLDIRSFMTLQVKDHMSAYDQQGKTIIKYRKKKSTCNNKVECKTMSSNSPFTGFDKSETDKSGKKISSLTLILFDDVDVVFDEDDGFWFAVNTFLKTSKKPVVFTVSRNVEIVLSNLIENVEILNINKGLENTAFKTVHRACENHMITIPGDLNTFVLSNGNDIRRCLLNLQFWYDSQKKANSKMNVSFEKKDKNYLEELTIKQNSVVNPFSVDVNKIQQMFSDSFESLLEVIMGHHLVGNDVLHTFMYDFMGFVDRSISHLWEEVIQNSYGDDIIEETATHVENERFANQTQKKTVLPDHFFSSLTSMLVDFSFSNVVMAQLDNASCRWLPVLERMNRWSNGLPSSSDKETTCKFPSLEMISVFNILTVKQSLCMTWSKQHTYTSIPSTLLEKSQRSSCQMKMLLTALPPSQHLSGKILLLDYLNALNCICQCENIRSADNSKRGGRFLHYFDSINLLLNPMEFH